FLQAPALVAGVLEVQVGVVDLVRADVCQGARQVRLVQPEGREQQLTGDGQALDGGFAGDHRRILGSRPQPRWRRGYPRYPRYPCSAPSRCARATDISTPSASPSVAMAVPP